jgi:glucose/arabinose dehydrogenase
LTVADGIGPEPKLPPPKSSLVPIVEIAPAVGWAGDRAPVAADGLTVAPFARGLDHPRWLHVLPNGDVLVAETNAPEREAARTGLKGAIMAKAMKKAGALRPASA